MFCKKTFLSLLCALTTAVSVSSADWTYTQSDRELKIEKNAGQNEFLSFTVSPYGQAMNEELINNGKVLTKSVLSNGTDLSATVNIPNNWQAGRYEIQTDGKVYYIILTGDEFKSNVGHATSKSDILALISESNGFDTTYKETIASVMANYIPEGGYDADTFVVQYMICEGLVKFRNKSIDVNKFLENYYIYLNEPVMDDDKEDFEKILDFYNGSPENLVKDGKVLYQIRTGNKATFSEQVILHTESLGLSKGNYSLLNSYYQNELWDSLYAKRTGYTSFKNVYSDFINETDEQYSKQKTSGKDYQSPSTGTRVSSAGASGGVKGSNGREENFAPNDIFPDMRGHWAQAQVEDLAKKGIINGFEDGCFRPEKNVTRAEFTKMITGILLLEDASTEEFKDVRSGDWYEEIIAAAYKAGIVTGSNGFFRPDDLITREEAAVLLYRTLNYSKISLEGASVFEDEELVSEYAKDAVSKLAANGIVKGFENRFRPKDTASRAEAAVMIARVEKIVKG